MSVLEAYNWAARETAYWVGRQKLDDDESWIVEGRRSVEIFKKLYVGGENDPATRKLSARSDSSAADAPVPPPAALTDPHDPWWLGRRALMERASLEDCGQELAASAVSGIGYEPLDGVSDGQPGNLARRVVLGRPALLELSSLLKKGTGSEPTSENPAKNDGSKVPVPFFQRAVRADR